MTDTLPPAGLDAVMSRIAFDEVMGRLSPEQAAQARKVARLDRGIAAEPPYACLECPDQQIADAAELMDHIRAVHTGSGETAPEVCCSSCGHRLPTSEARAGYTTCERCGEDAGQLRQAGAGCCQGTGVGDTGEPCKCACGRVGGES